MSEKPMSSAMMSTMFGRPPGAAAAPPSHVGAASEAVPAPRALRKSRRVVLVVVMGRISLPGA